MTPKRIQRSRAKGWHMPEGAVYVGRPTKWGNPFLVHPQQKPGRRWNVCTDAVSSCYSVPTPEDAVECFRLFITAPLRADLLADARSELRGKGLACWCSLDQPCHADVLLEIANGPRCDEVPS